MRNYPIISLIFVALFASSVAVAEQEFATPTAVIDSRATALAEKLQGRQAYYTENASELYELVGNILLPGFDIEYASKLVLGRTHWTAASAEQREAFIDAFYGFLVRTYSKGLIGFDQNDMTVESEPTYSKDRRKALVRTSVSLGTGGSVEINYALRVSDSGWKMYDVRIDGVSYIQNYRSQFDAEITALGLDAVIDRLVRESEEAAEKTSV